MNTFLKSNINNPMLLSAICILIGICCGLFSSVFSNVIPVIIGFTAIITISIVIRKHFVLVFLIWMSIQNAIIPYLYANTSFNPMVWTLLITIPLIVPVCVSIYWTITRFMTDGLFPKWSIVGLIYMLVVLGCSAPYLNKGLSLFNTIYYYRSLFLPLLYVVMGYVYTNSSIKNYKYLLKTMSIITIFGAAFALIDYFFITPDFWRDTAGLGDYWIDIKQLQKSQTLDGLPLNFFTMSGLQIIRRAVSFYGDPLAAGYSMAIGVVAWLMLRLGFPNEKKKSRFVTLGVLIFIAAGVAFTYTRAAYIIIATLIIYLLLNSKEFRKSFPKIGYVLIIGAFFYFGGSYIKDSFAGNNSSAVIHMNSVYTIGQLLSHPLGTGLYWLAPEGTVQSILWTIGVIPVIAFLIWVRSISPKKINFLGEIGRGMIWTLMISAFISFQIMSTSCAFAWMLLGGLLSIKAANKNSEIQTIENKNGLSEII